MLAFYVSSRSRELGVRLALGARPVEMRKLVLKRAVTLTFCGAIVGGTAAAGLARLLTSYLFQIQPLDAVTFASVMGGIMALSVAAAYVPARRASMIDPMVAVRNE